mmetsp:Transcript_27325/g.45068  ORF Transcript_27325/g.45068 Transcript_27325/m.45068 type:complete len:111 (-) Transcript_27325:363-695(-)
MTHPEVANPLKNKMPRVKKNKQKKRKRQQPKQMTVQTAQKKNAPPSPLQHAAPKQPQNLEAKCLACQQEINLKREEGHKEYQGSFCPGHHFCTKYHQQQKRSQRPEQQPC